MERRLVFYVTPEEVSHLSEHPRLYKCFEWSEMCPDRCQSTFMTSNMLEYTEGLITKDPNGRIEVHQSLTTMRHQMAKLTNNVDRLVVYECTGYCVGEPKRAHSLSTGWTSVYVEALRLDHIVIDNRARKGGETNGS